MCQIIQKVIIITLNLNTESSAKHSTFTSNLTKVFSNFSCMFLNPNVVVFNLNYNCSNLLDMRNLQEQVKKNIRLPKIVLTFHCLNKLF